MNDVPTIRKRIEEILIEALHLDPGTTDLSGVRTIDEAVGLDSIALLEFVVALEKAFGITLDTESLEYEVVNDLDRLAEYVAARLRPEPPNDPA